MFLLSMLFRHNVSNTIITSEALNYHYSFLQHALEYLHLFHSSSFNENSSYTRKKIIKKRNIFTHFQFAKLIKTYF